ncbi:hypothetical protein QQF64_028005 [Cirrhinus molitorella]|uniref:Transmembrane protein n=1 Tax=Cirrhinus molitorella TaxID=172907 RepID=A0ABR3NEE6_9TELE
MPSLRLRERRALSRSYSSPPSFQSASNPRHVVREKKRYTFFSASSKWQRQKVTSERKRESRAHCPVLEKATGKRSQRRIAPFSFLRHKLGRINQTTAKNIFAKPGDQTQCPLQTGSCARRVKRMQLIAFCLCVCPSICLSACVCLSACLHIYLLVYMAA